MRSRIGVAVAAALVAAVGAVAAVVPGQPAGAANTLDADQPDITVPAGTCVTYTVGTATEVSVDALGASTPRVLLSGAKGGHAGGVVPVSAGQSVVACAGAPPVDAAGGFPDGGNGGSIADPAFPGSLVNGVGGGGSSSVTVGGVVMVSAGGAGGEGLAGYLSVNLPNTDRQTSAPGGGGGSTGVSATNFCNLGVCGSGGGVVGGSAATVSFDSATSGCTHASVAVSGADGGALTCTVPPGPATSFRAYAAGGGGGGGVTKGGGGGARYEDAVNGFLVVAGGGGGGAGYLDPAVVGGINQSAVNAVGAGGSVTLSTTRPTVTLATSTPSVTEGQQGAYQLTLSHVSSRATTVHISVGFGQSNIVIPAGSLTADFRIDTADDDVYGPNSPLTVNIDSVSSNAVVGSPSSVDTAVLDNDPVPTVTLSGPASVGEADAKATYAATLSGKASVPVTVPWSLIAGTASVPGDVGPASGTVTIPALTTSATFDVAPVDDAVFEGDEAFTVSISTPTVATLGNPSSIGVTLVDNETFPVASITGPASVGEAAGTAVYTVKLSNATTQPITLPVSMVSGTAAAGADAYTLTASVTIPAGQTTATFPVTIVNDLLQESSETFSMVIGAPAGPAALGTSSVTTTIVDNDDRPGVELSGLDTVDEGDGTITYTVVLSTPSLAPVTVPWTVSGGSASVPGDVGPASGSVTIPAGQVSGTFTLAVIDDTVAEPDETYTVTLGTPSPSMPLGPTHAVTTTIVDDDAASPPPPGAPMISIAGTSVAEGTGATDTIARLTVSLDHASSAAVTVRYRTRPGSALAGQDYRTARGTLTIPAGQTSATIEVRVIADARVEPDETLRVVLTKPAGATLGAARRATLTILDDDRHGRR